MRTIHAALLLCLCMIAPAAAHPGGLDSDGGHARTDGTYHFHRGPLVGQDFASKAAAMAALAAHGDDADEHDQPDGEPEGLTTQQKLDALVALLLEKGLLGEEEWLDALRRVANGPGDGPDDPPGPGDAFEIAWWNIRDFSNASRDDTEMRQIAAALSGVEVVAVGELTDPVALQRLAVELGEHWRHAATQTKIGRTPQSAEHYGFLWDSRVVDLVGNVRVDPDPGDLIDRQPAWATFATPDRAFDFTLVAVHITWGNLVEDRRKEIRALPAVWQRVQAATATDDDLILLGDFNRNVGDEAFAGLLALPGVRCANPDGSPTHIWAGSSYDQVYLSTTETIEWLGTFDIVEFDETLFANDDDAANRACSDHRPVVIRVRSAAGDDE